MPLNGTAWAGYGNALAEYLEGATPDELTPVAGGTPIPFVHDARGEKAESTEAGLIVVRWLAVFIRTSSPPVVGDKFTYNGETWQAADVQPDRCAGADWPCYVMLTGHARQVAS